MDFYIDVNGSVFASGVINSGETAANTTTATQAPAADPNATDAPAASGGLASFLPMILIYGVLAFAIYFFLFRPQKKRDKQMKEMQNSLKVGDNVVTSSGFFGKIVELGQEANILEFGQGGRGVRVAVRKSDILGIKTPVLTPPIKEPVKEIVKDTKEKIEDKEAKK
ncbi:hypothetical protein FACS189490_13640 [Clostridia bacterium]|nr:hypothetical protein FACS189490_13640 [Clostridia bacterium]